MLFRSWLAAACLVPVCLACGNVYRTADWPAQADPLWLAVGSNAVAAALLLIVALATSDLHAIALMAGIPFVSVAQIIASALFYLLFFRLQRAAGPVTLSQIGTVAAGVGVCIGAAVLGERYAAVVWIGVAVITSGLALTVAARYRR